MNIIETIRTTPLLQNPRFLLSVIVAQFILILALVGQSTSQNRKLKALEMQNSYLSSEIDQLREENEEMESRNEEFEQRVQDLEWQNNNLNMDFQNQQLQNLQLQNQQLQNLLNQ